jgi:3-dehydroquinate synthase
VLRGLQDFREHLGGELTVTLLTAVGTTRDVHSMDEALLERVLTSLHEEDARCA